MPHLWNPDMMLTGVTLCGHAWPTDARISDRTTHPGFSAMYPLQALLKADVRDLNTPTSMTAADGMYGRANIIDGHHVLEQVKADV